MSLPTEPNLGNIEFSLANLDISKDVKIVDYGFYAEHNGILKNISFSTTNGEKIRNIKIHKNNPRGVMAISLEGKGEEFRAKSQLNNNGEVEVIDDFQSTDGEKLSTTYFHCAKPINAFGGVVPIPRLDKKFGKNQLNEKGEVEIIDLIASKGDRIIGFKPSIGSLTNAFGGVIGVMIEGKGEEFRAKSQLNNNGEVEVIDLKTTEGLKVTDINYVEEKFGLVSLNIVDKGPWNKPELVFANSKLNEEGRVVVRDIHVVDNIYHEKDANGDLVPLKESTTAEILNTTNDLTEILQEEKDL